MSEETCATERIGEQNTRTKGGGSLWEGACNCGGSTAIDLSNSLIRRTERREIRRGP